MSAAWPLVVARLVDHLPTLDGWADVPIFDGPPNTQDSPPVYVTVGYVEGEDFGGSYEQTRNGEGGWAGSLHETGTVRSEIVCWTGDDDIAGLRALAFSMVDAWEAWVSGDETLGVMLPSSVASLAVDVQPIQNDAGSAQRLTVTVSYFSRS